MFRCLMGRLNRAALDGMREEWFDGAVWREQNLANHQSGSPLMHKDYSFEEYLRQTSV